MSPKKKEITRFGLIAIKNIGIQVADDIVKERKANGDYKSLTDFCERNCASGAANKTTIENFAKAGAMDCFNYTRKTHFKHQLLL